jgi:hypothetical protein
MLRGAVPVEWVGVAQPQGPLGVVRALVGTALVPVAFAVSGLAWSIGRSAGPEAGPIAPLAGTLLVLSLVAAAASASQLVQALARRGRGRPSVVLDDGSRIAGGWARAWQVSQLVQIVAGGAAIGLGPALVEYALLGTLRTTLLAIPFGLLYALGLAARARSIALVLAAHGSDRQRWLRVSEAAMARRGAGGLAAGWTALARLWQGDADGALAAAELAARFNPEARELAGWIVAARGEVDTERLLSVPTPEEPGAALRLAVRRGLGLLAAGRAVDARGWLDAWGRLGRDTGNRFGDLLLLVVAAIRHDLGEPYDLTDVDLSDLDGVVSAMPVLQPVWRHARRA